MARNGEWSARAMSAVLRSQTFAWRRTSMVLPNGHGAQLRAAREREWYIRRAAGESTAGPAARRLEGLRRPSGGGASAAAPCWAAGPRLRLAHRRVSEEDEPNQQVDQEASIVEIEAGPQRQAHDVEEKKKRAGEPCAPDQSADRRVNDGLHLYSEVARR